MTERATRQDIHVRSRKRSPEAPHGRGAMIASSPRSASWRAASKTVQAISGSGYGGAAQRGRVVPAESVMSSDGPHGRCARVGSTSEHSTRTPMYMSAGQRCPVRSAQTSVPQLMRDLRRLQPAKRKACVPRAPEIDAAGQRPGRWPAAAGSSRDSHSRGARSPVGTCAYHLNPGVEDNSFH